MGSNAQTVSPVFIVLAAFLALAAGAVPAQAAEETGWGYNCAEGAHD